MKTIKELPACKGANCGNNILDAPNRFRHPFRKPKIRKNPVTLIVGIICKDAIVLAADSQTTYYPSKILGTNKISEVKFKNGSALIAEAGFVTYSNEAVDIIQKKAAETEIKNEETIAGICRDAVFEVRKKQIGLYPRRRYSLVEWRDFFRDNQDFFLTVAYYFEDKPYLYGITLSECSLRKPTFGFIVSGIGEAVGNYILKEEHDSSGGFEKMDSELTTVIAIKVADVAAEYVDGCGRPIMAALIKPSIPIPDLLSMLRGEAQESAGYSLLKFSSYRRSEPVTIFPQEKVDKIAKIISAVEQKVKISQNKKINQALKRQTQKTFKEIVKAMMLNRRKTIADNLSKIKMPVRQSLSVQK